MDSISGAGTRPLRPVANGAKTTPLSLKDTSRPLPQQAGGTGALPAPAKPSKLTLEGITAPLPEGAPGASLPLDTPARRREFKRLLPDEQAAFESLYQTLKAEKGSKAGKYMMGLLESKKLSSLDSTGKSLMEQIASRMDDQPAKALGKAKTTDLLYDMIKGIAKPEKIFQGDGTYTCGAASVQGILASESPAEYARLALGLTFDGKVKTKSGKTMALDTSEVGRKDGAREIMDEAVQGSFKAHAQKYPDNAAETDPNRAGRFERFNAYGNDYGAGRLGFASRFGAGRLGAAMRYGAGRLGAAMRFGGGMMNALGQGGQRGKAGKTEDGVTQSQLGKLYEDVVGRKTVQMPVNAQNHQVVFAALKEVLDKDLKIPVGLTVKDKNGFETNHVVTLEGIKKGTPPQAVVQDSGSGTTTTMPLPEFMRSMKMAIVPTEDIRLLAALRNASRTPQYNEYRNENGDYYSPQQSYGEGGEYNTWLQNGQNSDAAFYTYNQYYFNRF